MYVYPNPTRIKKLNIRKKEEGNRKTKETEKKEARRAWARRYDMHKILSYYISLIRRLASRRDVARSYTAVHSATKEKGKRYALPTYYPAFPGKFGVFGDRSTSPGGVPTGICSTSSNSIFS